jgi:hypothetical protein
MTIVVARSCNSNALKVQTAESLVIAGQKISADLRLRQKKKSVA